jgi:Outer membrane protein beta-barrel domain
MQQSEFEKQVQQKMEELKLSPADAVWEKVEAGLPAEKKPRRRIFFILLLAGLLTASLLLWNKFDTANKQVAANDTAVKENVLQNNTAQNKDKKETPSGTEIIARQNSNDAIKIKPGSSNVDKTSGTIKIKSKPKSEVAINNKPDINSIIAKVKTKAVVKIKTKIPAAVDDEQELIVAREEKKLTENTKTVVRVGTPAPVNGNVTEALKKLAADSSSATNKDVAINKDTAIITATSKIEKKKNHPQWQYGIRVAAGSGALKKDLFGNKALFTADAAALGNTGGFPPPVQTSSKPNNPATGLTFNIGFYVQKNINSRWGFSSGLNYAYQSNTIEVGKRVDSVVNFYSGSLNNRLDAAGYYTGGSVINYKNKFHLIEVPLLFQWKLSKKSPFYFAGQQLVI